MNVEDIDKKSKYYAITRTYPRFENDFIADFVLREVEGAYFNGATYVLNETNKRIDDFENMKAGLEVEITKLKEENNNLRNNYEDYRAIIEPEITRLKEIVIKVKKCAHCDVWLHNQDIKLCKNCACVEAVNVLRNI